MKYDLMKNLQNMLTDISLLDKDTDKMFMDMIETRLNKCNFQYEKVLQENISVLLTKNPITIQKKLNKR